MFVITPNILHLHNPSYGLKLRDWSGMIWVVWGNGENTLFSVGGATIFSSSMFTFRFCHPLINQDQPWFSRLMHAPISNIVGVNTNNKKIKILIMQRLVRYTLGAFPYLGFPPFWRVAMTMMGERNTPSNNRGPPIRGNAVRKTTT